MPSEDVRIRRGGPAPDPAAPAALRRRPRQSRARQSHLALQEAFVRVLLERGYARTTIREVASVAGVGVGTFYDYFGNMRALAAKCISEAVRGAEQEGRQAIEHARGQPLDAVVDALLDALIGSIVRDTPAWAALMLLERQLSSSSAYRQHYESWVAMWQLALESAAQPPAQLVARARMSHAITYGWVEQSLLTLDPPPTREFLRAEIGRAVKAYLAAP